MVFDFIEPYRTWADEAIFKLFSAKKVNKTHTETLANGIGLTKEGKNLIAEQFTNFLDGDAIRHKNRNEKRGNILQLDAHAFANKLLEWKEISNFKEWRGNFELSRLDRHYWVSLFNDKNAFLGFYTEGVLSL